jgi:hypothetical protein
MIKQEAKKEAKPTKIDHQCVPYPNCECEASKRIRIVGKLVEAIKLLEQLPTPSDSAKLEELNKNIAKLNDTIGYVLQQ